MPKYNFNLRDSSAKGETPVNFVIRWGNRRLVYPTREAISPRWWNADRQRAKETSAFAEYPEFNERLDNLLTAAKATFRSYETDNGREPEVEELRAALDVALGRTEQRSADLFSFAAEYIAGREGATGKGGKLLHATYHGRNRIALRLLKDYAASTRRGRRIPFGSVDKAFVDGFAKYLTTTRGLSTNTVGKYMRALREFVNKAADEGHELRPAILKRGGIAIPEEETHKVYLNPEELAALLNFDLRAHPRLERARDLFIAGAWTGLRFGDLTRVRPEHIEGERIRIRASKTGREVTLPLHPHVRFLLNKYGGALPPAISNQKQNDYIKEAAAMVPELQERTMQGRTTAGIHAEVSRAKWEQVTTHTARRSFATNLYRSGVPARSIMALTGHRTEEVFRRYIRLDNEEHADIVAASPVFQLAPLKAVRHSNRHSKRHPPRLLYPLPE